MLELLIAIYAGICWLLIKKLKLIPWTFTTQVVVYSLPIFGSIALILSLNYYCPITSDVKVGNRSGYYHPGFGKGQKSVCKHQSGGKERRHLVCAGQEPYLQEIKSLEAKLSNMKATVSSYNTDISASRKNIAGLQSQLDLAHKRVAQYRELVAAGAANRFDLEQAETNVRDLQSRISAAQSQQQSLETKSNASYGGENSSVSRFRPNWIRRNGIYPKQWFLPLQMVLFPTYS